MKVNIALGLGDFDTGLAAQAVDTDPDFASHLIGVGAPKVEPIVKVKIQGLVAKRLEDHRARWFLQDFGLFLKRPAKRAQDQFGRNAIRHANDEVIAVVRIRKGPIDDVFLQKVAIGNEDVHAVRFPDTRATRPQIYDASKMAVRVNNIANFDLLLRQKDQTAYEVVHQRLGAKAHANRERAA